MIVRFPFESTITDSSIPTFTGPGPFHAPTNTLYRVTNDPEGSVRYQPGRYFDKYRVLEPTPFPIKEGKLYADGFQNPKLRNSKTPSAKTRKKKKMLCKIRGKAFKKMVQGHAKAAQAAREAAGIPIPVLNSDESDPDDPD